MFHESYPCLFVEPPIRTLDSLETSQNVLEGLLGSFIQSTTQRIWEPSCGPPESRDYIRSLNIPAVRTLHGPIPSLLLHNLGTDSRLDERVNEIFINDPQR